MIGWIIAQLNFILKNKKILQPLISVLLLVGFYVFNSRLTSQLGKISSNDTEVATQITRSLRFLKLFGQVGTGDFLSIAIMTVATLIVFAGLIFILSKSFYKLALGNGSASKTAYKEEKIKDRTPFSALLGKESRRFFGNFYYLLNCGLGSLFIIIVGGVLCFISIQNVFSALSVIPALAKFDVLIPVIAFAGLAVSASLNFMVVPSVSLEGKNFWILRSMPIKTQSILWSKILFQILVTGIPTLGASLAMIVGLVIGKTYTVLDLIFILILPLAFEVFMAVCGMMIGLLMPNLTWTNETVPIKQSISTFIAILVGMVLTIILAGGYFLIGYKIGGYLYMGLVTVILAVLSVIAALWVNRAGVAIFEHL